MTNYMDRHIERELMLTYIDWFGGLWFFDSWHEDIEIRLTDETGSILQL